MLVPNPNFPEVTKPGRLLRIHHDAISENHSVAVVADWATANGTLVNSGIRLEGSFNDILIVINNISFARSILFLT